MAVVLPFCLAFSIVSAVGVAFLVDRRRGGIGRLQDLASLGPIARLQFVPLVKRKKCKEARCLTTCSIRQTSEFADVLDRCAENRALHPLHGWVARSSDSVGLLVKARRQWRLRSHAASQH